MNDRPKLRSYGRVKGRALSTRQAQLVAVLLPHLAIPAAGEIEVDGLFSVPPPLWGRVSPRSGDGWGGDQNKTLAPPAYAVAPCPLPPPHEGEGGAHTILEIGFGAGEHLVAQAAAHPHARFLGVEPFLNGVAQCLARIEDAGVTNIRLHHGDARDVLARLPDAGLDRVYILFPDPWPKQRHWKRRLIQPDFIAALARVVKPGGEVRFAADWRHYAAWTLELFLKEKRFAWCAECADDWRLPWPGHIPTRYEQKKLGDSEPIHLRFERIAPI